MRAYNLETALARRDEVTELYLHNCQLDHLPPAVFGMPKLKRLEITGNLLSEIPPQIRQLKQLQSLSFRFNKIKTLPPQLFKLQQLEELNLGHNQIAHLPAAIVQLKSLQALRLGGNALKELPDEITRLKKLRYLEVYQNQLKKLPARIEKLAELRQLQAADNSIGRLPRGFFRLQKLDVADLSQNRIRTLSEHIGQLQQLSTLQLSHNRIQVLPKEISRLLMLRRLGLANNKLKSIPAGIGQLQWLARLNLEKNKLQQLPESIGLCRRLEALLLSDNALSTLPASIIQLKSLRLLLLNNNHFRQLPPLPTGLTRLAISNNQLAELPESIQQLYRLHVLEAEKNKLSDLPPSFRRLHNLNTLLLRGNPISDLPQPLFFLPALKELKGPSDARTRRKLMRFLRHCHSREVPGRLRLVVYDVMEEEGRGLKDFPIPLLLEALSVGMSDVAYPIRKHLLEERSATQHITAPFEGAKVYLLGETGFEPERLRLQLDKLGLELTTDPEQDIDYMVLGRMLRAMQPEVPTNFRHLLSRRRLAQFLNRQLGRRFAIEANPQQLSNLRQMIFSPERAQRTLALQLLKTNGVPKQLLTDLFLAWKLGYGEQRTLESLLLQHTSEEALQAMYYPLGLAGRTTEATLTTNIIKYTEDNEFDGKHIAQFLNELYGTARFYLKRYG